MNCEPCNSLEITCNHNVTIGYLKELVAAIPGACCTRITVTGNDSYCPTYGELTGGTLIPNFSDGGNYAWSNNVDGIVVSPGYSNNQCVAKKDLKLIYTAFESLVVSNPSPIVSECGGSTTTTKTLTFRKYTKECDKAVTSTTQVDTTLRVTWSGTDGSNTGTKSYPINNSFTDTHPSTVYCTINWRGCSYTSNSITVSQKIRAFSHYDDYSRSSGQSVDVSCYPYSFDCKGGTSEATATYYYTTWTERHHIDTCNRDYYQENVSIIRDNTLDVSNYLNATSYTYECQVTTADESRFTFEATYDGLYGSDSCWQVCSQCADCPPKPFSSYTDVEVACSALSARVIVSAYTFSGGELDGSGNCTGWTSAATDASYTSAWTCDTDGGWIDEHIYVTGAPCCPTSTAYTYDDVTIPCEASNSKTVSVGWTCVVHNADGTTTTTTGTNPNTPIPAVACNPTTSTKEIQSRIVAETLELSRPLVTQLAGPCCPESDTFKYDDVTVSCSGTPATTMSVGYTQYHIGPDGSETVTTHTNNVSISAVACNTSSTTIILQTNESGTTLASARPGIAQEAGPCCPTGDTFKYDDITIPCSGTPATTQSVGYTRYHLNADGTTTTTTSTNPNTPIPAVTCNSQSTTVTVQTNQSGTTLASARPGITQAAGPCCCSCEDLVVCTSYEVGPAGATNGQVGYFNSGTCVTGLTVTASLMTPNNWISNLSANADGTITGTYGENTSPTDVKTAIITVTGSDGTTTCTKSYRLTQHATTCEADSCTCYVITNSSTSSTESITCDSTAVTLSWNYEERMITTGNDCSVSSQVINTGSESVRVTFSPNTNGTSSVTRNGSYTWTGHNKCGNNSCTSETITISWSVTLPPCGCDCSDIRLTKES